MNIAKTYPKLSVATQQLDTALRLYFEGEEFFSVITLAGAAEEILAVFLKCHGQPNAFEEQIESSLMVYEWMFGNKCAPKSMEKTVNRVKNAAKHMLGKADLELSCNVEEEAKSVLDRAVTNYFRLMAFEELEETQRIREFNEHIVSGA